MTANAGAAAVRPMWLVAAVVAIAPLVVLPAQVDFALLPQQAFIQAASLALAVYALARRDLRERLTALRLRSLDVALVAFVGWSAVSLALTPDRQVGARVLAHWLACGVVYVLVSRLARPRDARLLAGAALVGATSIAWIGLAQVAFHIHAVPQAAGPSATMANRDLAGAYLAVVVPLAILAWGRRRWPVVVALAPVLLFLPFTRSRGAALAVALQLLILGGAVLARVFDHRLRVRALAVALALVTLGAAATLTWTVTDEAKGRSLGIRWDLAAAALAMGVAHPAHGVGLGRFEAVYPAYGPAVRGEFGVLRVEHAHDEILETVAECGVPGLLALAGIVLAAGTSLARIARSRHAAHRRAALALGLCAIAFVVDAAFGFPLRTALAPLALAVVLGLCSSLERAVMPVPTACPTEGARVPRWLVWTFGPAAALVLAGVTALSFVRLAADAALHEMTIAEAEWRYADAVVAGRSAARLDPRPEVLLALARAELRVGHRRTALALLQRVLAARPYDATAVATLGSARWAAGDVEGARASWHMARLLGVGDPVPAWNPRASEPAQGAAGCNARVTVAVAADGHVALAAHGELLTDVLRCVAARTGLKVDYDGPQPRQRVSVDIPATPLPAVLASLFEGLGLNYVVGGGAAPGQGDRLIVFAGSSSPSRPAAAGASASPPAAAEPPPMEGGDEPSFGEPPFAPGGDTGEPPPAISPQGPRGYGGVGPTMPQFGPQPGPGEPAPQSPQPGQPGSAPAPERPPEFPQPGQLTPTVRHWEPWPPVASAGAWGDRPGS